MDEAATIVTPEVQAAIQDRKQAEAALAATQRKAEQEHEAITLQLRRSRKDMLQFNHVADNIRRMIQEGR